MIHPYHPSDLPEVLQLLRLNTPQYFHPEEEKDFVDYLENDARHYFVMEEYGKITGCGGINYFEEEALARISWDIVHPHSQGKGIGKSLTHFRIYEVKKHPNIKTIIVRTSQLAYRFYEKMGFELVSVENDFWAKGFDLYVMKMPLHPPTSGTASENFRPD